MQEAQNTQLVQDAYAAFLRGDVPAILGLLDENVVWKPGTGASPDVPMAGERHGKASVGEFFRLVGENISFTRFEPRQFVAQGDTVVALGHYTGTTPQGAVFDSDFVMVFTIRGGKVIGFQEFLDSAAMNAAYGVNAGSATVSAH